MFSPEAVDQLVGPDWLQVMRREALERAGQTGLPSAEEEVWRYTPIGDLVIDRFSSVTAAGTADEFAFGGSAAVEGAACVVDFVDGHLIGIESDESLAAGLSVERVADGDQADSVIGRALPRSADVFNDVNLGLSPDPVVVRISKGAELAGPVIIRHRTATDMALVCSRVVVIAEENSEATVVEVHESTDSEALTIPVTEIVVEQAARLRYMAVQALGEAAWQLGTQVATIERDGHLLAGTVAIGGKYSRVRTDTKMIGRGAEGDIVAVYFGSRDQTLDFRTFQQHVAPDTNSNLLFKGALDDRARSIYTGLIRIEKNASGVAAHQTNRNIKLSDEAWAESVPNLEIENNDVKCSHASAVGPIDEEQQFYLESRGVPAEVAERLVVQGFFKEVLSQLPHAGLAAAVEAALTDRLQVGAAS